ncbi:TPA: Gp49 family protein [Vibrio harveyi]
MTDNRVTIARVSELIDSCTEQFHHFEGTTLTVCALFLPDGFHLAIGQSSCVDPNNFDADMGKRIAASDARRKAIDKIWELEGYVLKQKLKEQPNGNDANS